MIGLLLDWDGMGITTDALHSSTVITVTPSTATACRSLIDGDGGLNKCESRSREEGQVRESCPCPQTSTQVWGGIHSCERGEGREENPTRCGGVCAVCV